MSIREVKLLLRKEIVLEWRTRYALNGILLYVVGAVFVCYMSFKLRAGALNVPTWNALFWIVMLFAAVNAVAKSFLQEQSRRLIYYYTIASPQGVIVAKMIYNTLLLLLLAIICLVVFSVMMGNEVQNGGLFVANLLLGSVGFSVTLTMVSGIAAKASNSSTLMAVLGFPIMIPLLLMVMKISKNAIDGLDTSVSYDDIVVLMAINGIVASLSYVLFPYLWRS